MSGDGLESVAARSGANGLVPALPAGHDWGMSMIAAHRRKSTARIGTLLMLVAIVGAAAPAAAQPRTQADSASDDEAGGEVAVVEAPAEPTLADQADSILERIDQLSTDYNALKDRAAAADDAEQKAIAELQAQRHLVEWMRSIDALVRNLLEQTEGGADTSKLLQRTRKILWTVERRLPKFMDEVMEKNAALRTELASAPPERVGTAVTRIRGTEEILDETVRFHLTLVRHLDALDIGSARARASTAVQLEERAGNLSARLELESETLAEAEARQSESGGPEQRAAVRDAQENFDQTAASLWTTCDVMDELGLPTADHRQALILATGELTTDVLDTEVLAGLVDDAVESSRRWLEHRGPALVGRAAIFVAILVAFAILGRIVRWLAPLVVRSSGEQLSELGRRVIVGTTSQLVFGIGVLVALSQIGVNVTALLTGLGIVGFIIGFALQDTLGNFASGAMIILYRPFDVGDVIEAAGVLGTVDHMTLVSTTILTFDNQTMIVPNTRIWGNVIRNATALEQRRVDLSFPLALDVDVEAAEAVFEAMCRAHPAVLEDPPPAIKVQNVSGTGVVFVVRPWVRTEDYWPTFWDLNREGQIRLKEAGIEIALPRFDPEPAGAK